MHRREASRRKGRKGRRKEREAVRRVGGKGKMRRKFDPK